MLQFILHADDGATTGSDDNSCADGVGRAEALGVAAATRRCMTCAQCIRCARLHSSRVGAGALQPLVRPLRLSQPAASCRPRVHCAWLMRTGGLPVAAAGAALHGGHAGAYPSLLVPLTAEGSAHALDLPLPHAESALWLSSGVRLLCSACCSPRPAADDNGETQT